MIRLLFQILLQHEYEYNFVPKDMGWSIKVIGKTGFGKINSLSGLVVFFIQYFKPAMQKVWDRIKKNLKVISTIAEINDTINALIICDDDQLVVNRNKLLTQILLNERHRSTCVIQ